VDPDLHLDLRHLDDPEPPQFGPLRAGEATRRAADNRIRRARLVAAAVLSVSLLLGLGATTLSRAQERDLAETAAVTSTTPEPTEAPLETTFVPTTAPGAVEVQPGGDAAAWHGAGGATVPPSVPPPPSAPVTAGGPGAGGAVVPTRPAAVAPSTVPPPPSGQPPNHMAPAPAGIVFTLRLDARQVVVGGRVRGVVRFENNRSATAVLHWFSECGPWQTYLYRFGEPVTGPAHDCFSIHVTEVAPGTAQEAEVWVNVDSRVQPGSYDVFSSVDIKDERTRTHSTAQALTVVRP